MKQLKLIGLVLFVMGMIGFTANIFMGEYVISKETVTAHFDDGSDKINKQDSIAEHFIATAEFYSIIGGFRESYGSQRLLFSDVSLIIEAYNATIVDKWFADKVISEDEIGFLFHVVQMNGSVTYNSFILDSVFNQQTEKIQSLKDNTSWMFDDQKTYPSIEDFKNDLNPKIKEINDAAAGDYILHDDKATHLAMAKSFNIGTSTTNPGLVFLLTFGLIILGTLLYNIPDIWLLGPAGIKNNHIYQNGLTNRGFLAWIVLVYMVGFYLLMYFWPQYLNNNIVLVSPISKFLSGNAASEWFLYGFIYSVAMTLMAVRMYIKYRHNNYQIARTTVVLFFQIAFAFIIPELLVRFNMPYYDFKNAWPLDYDFLFDWNISNLLENGFMGLFMLIWGLALTIIIVPVMVYFFGKRWYCSWVCGCGGLAETVGDPYRQNSSKTLKSWRFERYIIHIVLVFAILMTIGAVYTFFNNNPEGYWLTKTHFVVITSILSLGVMALVKFGKDEIAKISNQTRMIVYITGGAIIAFGIIALITGNANILWIDSYAIRATYGFLIGSIFSGVIGTGFYPIFGNRVWCRFGCPLAAYMGLIQRFKSKFRITTNGGQCISCGNCSTYCEQGIDVRAYAQKGEDIVRASCVGCGVCSAVCPRGVLKLENSDAPKKINDNPLIFENNIVKINPDV